MASVCVSGGQFGVAGWREFPLEVLNDVQRQAADQCDGRHLPNKRPRDDKLQV